MNYSKLLFTFLFSQLINLSLLQVEQESESDAVLEDGSINLQGDTIQRIVWKAFVDEVSERMTDSAVWWIPLKVLSGSYQIVAGMQYELRVLGGESDCWKRVIQSREVNEFNCNYKRDGKRAIFRTLIYESNVQWKGLALFRSFSEIERNLTEGERVHE